MPYARKRRMKRRKPKLVPGKAFPGRAAAGLRKAIAALEAMQRHMALAAVARWAEQRPLPPVHVPEPPDAIIRPHARVHVHRPRRWTGLDAGWRGYMGWSTEPPANGGRVAPHPSSDEADLLARLRHA